MYDELYHGLPWRQRSDMKNGEKYLQPRLTAWYGDHPYSYSGITHEACTEVKEFFFIFFLLILFFLAHVPILN